MNKKERSERMGHRKYKIGDVLDVEVTGIQNYGVFAKLDESTQGLIHISEIKHSYIEESLQELFSLGDQLKVMILDIDEYDGRISLSLRALKETDHHPFSKRKTNPRYGRLTGTAFSSLAKKLPQWIKRDFKK